MSMRRWAVATTLGVLLVGGLAAGIAVHAQAGPPQGGRWAGPWGMARGMPALREFGLRALDLSDAQREQVRNIQQSHRDALRQLGDRLRTAHANLNEAVVATPVDEATIRARSAEVAAVQADMAVLRARIHGEVWAVLTPEQQQQATELRARRAERRQQRRARPR